MLAVWKKGQSGNPAGRAASKPFLDALTKASAQENYARLRACAEKLLDLAAEGEPWAVQMLADRFDGKAQQTIDVAVSRRARDLSDDELADIAAGSSTGTDAAQDGAQVAGIVH
jgi:hypothetical protein